MTRKKSFSTAHRSGNAFFIMFFLAAFVPENQLKCQKKNGHFLPRRSCWPQQLASVDDSDKPPRSQQPSTGWWHTDSNNLETGGGNEWGDTEHSVDTPTLPKSTAQPPQSRTGSFGGGVHAKGCGDGGGLGDGHHCRCWGLLCGRPTALVPPMRGGGAPAAQGGGALRAPQPGPFLAADPPKVANPQRYRPPGIGRQAMDGFPNHPPLLAYSDALFPFQLQAAPEQVTDVRQITLDLTG